MKEFKQDLIELLKKVLRASKEDSTLSEKDLEVVLKKEIDDFLFNFVLFEKR
jgi:hypothetical protein